MEEPEWFYVHDGKRQGPVSLEQLVELIITGTIPRSALVWHEALSEWVPAGSLPELSSQLPPPLPESRTSGSAQVPAGRPPASAKEPAWYKATWDTPNRYATAGLWMALVSIFCFTIGLIPVLSVVFSAIGLSKAAAYGGWGKTRAKIGLVVGIAYTLVYLQHYGHLR